MKFQQLKIGQKFEYQGDIYVKHSPLVAIHSETGKQKLIPRYAAIVVTDAAGGSCESPTGPDHSCRPVPAVNGHRAPGDR